MPNPFQTEGNWYKGNLHTHTNYSDGELSLERVIESYQEHNYDFLAITDHLEKVLANGWNQYEIVRAIKKRSAQDFLLLPGVEINAGRNSFGEPYHLIGIDMDREIEVSLELEVQEGIDLLKEKGSEVIVGHPYFLGLTTDELFPLEGQLGIEIYNTTCLRVNGKGLSCVHWDALLAKGKLNWGFAVDDAHFSRQDAYGGWIMVKATSLDKESIISSLKKGLFYSSSGPQIEEIDFDGKKVYVRNSAVKVISFVCDNWKGRSIWNRDGKELLEAEFQLEGTEKYLRIECIDRNGQTAWTNPLFLRPETIEENSTGGGPINASTPRISSTG